MAYQFTGSELSPLQNAYNDAVTGGSWASVYATISARFPRRGIEAGDLSDLGVACRRSCCSGFQQCTFDGCVRLE